MQERLPLSFMISVKASVSLSPLRHSTDAGGVALYSYAEFDSVDNEDCYRLMDMCDRNGNRDGAALRFVARAFVHTPGASEAADPDF